MIKIKRASKISTFIEMMKPKAHAKNMFKEMGIDALATDESLVQLYQLFKK